MTRDDLTTYIAKLHTDALELFAVAEDMHNAHAHDTLSEEFQIAAEVLEVFNRRARDQVECTCGEGGIDGGPPLPHKTFCPKYGE